MCQPRNKYIYGYHRTVYDINNYSGMYVYFGQFCFYLSVVTILLLS